MASWDRRRHRGLRLALVLALATGPRAASGASRVPNPVSLWQFARADCRAGVVPNEGQGKVFGALVRNGTDGTSCLDGRGIVGEPHLPQGYGITMESLGTMGELIDTDPKGLTFEMWGMFNLTDTWTEDNVRRPLFTIGQQNDFDTNGECDSPNPEYDFTLELIGKNHYLYIAAPDQVASDDDTCIDEELLSLAHENVTHMVVTINGTTVDVYANGELIDSNWRFYTKLCMRSGENDLEECYLSNRWSTFTRSFRVQLFSTAQSTDLHPLHAQLYLVSIYDRALSASEVGRRLQTSQIRQAVSFIGSFWVHVPGP